MKICNFCEAQNEDWMEICQQCGNPLEKNSSSSNNKKDIYSSSSSNEVQNKDLKLAILVLSTILAILLIYTLSTLT